MNQFIAQIKVGGEWQQVNAIFPFSMGELLDERLDEAYLTFFDETKAYAPLTEFRIIFTKTRHKYYFILANDNSCEYPAGSERYKHQVYLLERTKLLDGILAPSITFTNSKGADYLSVAVPVLPCDANTDSVVDDPLPAEILSTFTVEEFVSPCKKGKVIKILSASDVGLKMIPLITQLLGDGYKGVVTAEDELTSSTAPTQTTIQVDDEINQVLEMRDGTTVVLSDSLKVNYFISFKFDGPNHVVYKTYNFFFVIRSTDSIPRLPRYTITDVINRVLELAEPLRKGENPRFRLEGITYTEGEASKPAKGSQAEKYSKIYAPEFTMTQSTLREQLKVIGGFIHAEPWLDENDVVHFLEHGQTAQSENISSSAPYISNTLKTDINQYCTDIRSNAQNLVSSLGYAKGVVVEPGGGLYRSLRSETMYVRVNETNGIATTDMPIYSIEQVLCGISANSASVAWTIPPVDITPYVFEATEYGSNLSSQSGAYPYSKSYAIYYTQGQKGLHGLFFMPEDAANTAAYSRFAISNILAAASGRAAGEVHTTIRSCAAHLVFQITYKPITSAMLSHGKQCYISGDVPYTQVYSQSENLVESEFFGDMMKGVAARLGNVEQERTYILPSADKIPHVGEMLDDYAISAVSCEYMPHYVKCTVGLTKDFNRISEYVGINSIKRMYEISERQVQQRQILIKEIVLISGEIQNSDEGAFFHDVEYFLTPFMDANARQSYYPVAFAMFKGYSQNGNAISGKEFYLPCIGRAFGNGVHFSFTMKDNYSAGDKVEYESEGSVSGYWQNDANYTDFYGRVYWAEVFLIKGITAGEANISLGSKALPEALNASESYAAKGTVEKKHRLRKDNRETISYNIEAEYKTDQPDIVIGPALAKNCSLICGSDEAYSTPRLYLTNTPIGKFDKQFWNIDLDAVGGIFIPDSVDCIQLSVSAAQRSAYKYWVICTTPNYYTQLLGEDDSGKSIIEEIYEGGDVFLAGELNNSFEKAITGRYRRTLYFRVKRN